MTATDELQNTQLAILRELRDINRFLCVINVSLQQIVIATGSNDGVPEGVQKALIKVADMTMNAMNKRFDNRPKI